MTRICSLLVSLTTVLGGCSAYAGDESLVGSELAASHVAPSKEALFLIAPAKLIPNGSVRVCFNPVFGTSANNPNNVYDFNWTLASPTDPDAVRYMDKIEEVVALNYERIYESDIDFYGWDICEERWTGMNPGEIRVNLHLNANRNGAFRQCPVTEEILSETVGECGSQAGYSSSLEMTVYLASRYPHGSNDEDDPGFASTVLHEFGHALGMSHEFLRTDDNTCDGDFGGWQGEFAYTPLDRESVMSATYCHYNAELSDLDKVGLSVAYPSSLNHDPVIMPAAFWVGGRAVTLDGNAVALTPWFGRGALEETATSIEWQLDGDLQSNTSNTLGLPSNDVTLEAEFTDQHDRDHSIGAVDIDVNPRLFAALLNSAL